MSFANASHADVNTYVSPRSTIHPNVFIGAGVRVYGATSIGSGSIIEDYCLIGKPDMYALSDMRRNVPKSDDEYDQSSNRPTIIGEGVILGAGTQIYCGSELGRDVETEELVRIGWDAVIGDRTRLMYRAQVYCGVHIGSDCGIAGFLGDNTRIGDRVAFFGSTVHDYPYRTTTYEYRPSPVVEDDAIVGSGSQLIGGIIVGARAYVAANAVLTRSVPADHVGYGINQACHKTEWAGRLGRFV
jgi:acetyltransferase-like isoleucine patch superfamily enzyme